MTLHFEHVNLINRKLKFSTCICSMKQQALIWTFLWYAVRQKFCGCSQIHCCFSEIISRCRNSYIMFASKSWISHSEISTVYMKCVNPEPVCGTFIFSDALFVTFCSSHYQSISGLVSNLRLTKVPWYIKFKKQIKFLM